MKVYEMTIADIASEIFDKGEDFAEKIFNDIDELEKNKLLEIDQLKQQLAEKDKEINSLIIDYEKRISQEQELMSNLEKQLVEKEEELLKQKEKSARTEQIYNGIIVDKDKEITYWKDKTKNKILNMKTTDFVKMCLSCGIMVDIKQIQTQLAIQELEKVKDWLNEPFDEDGCFKIGGDLIDFIDQQIKELKGEDDE